MKLSIRLVACAFVLTIAAAGNTLPKASTIAPVPQSSTVPGPTPYCNPFTQVCPPIR